MEFTLKDGTKIGGLYFPKAGPAPLVIGSFGFIADRWGHATAQFVRHIIERDVVNAHFLILDAASSAPFYAKNNQGISMGAYDEGRIFIEVAEQMRTGQPQFKQLTNLPPITSIHLFGVSMSGIGVVHALVEDKRLGKNIFTSGMTVSAVTDLATQPGRMYSAFGPKDQLENYWGFRQGPGKSKFVQLGAKILFGHFEDVVSRMMGFKMNLMEKNESLGGFIYNSMVTRLDRLRAVKADAESQWNPKVKVDSVEDYAKTTDLRDFVYDVKTPLAMVHSIDDPVVPYGESLDKMIFYKKRNGVLNPFVTTTTLKDGGHWGLSASYGHDWFVDMVKSVLTPQAKCP